MNSARPQTTLDWLIGAMRHEIMIGRLEAGSALRQEELAARYGVSRMPVREAMGRLAAEGWIIERPNRKAIVAPLDPDDAREIFLIRTTLEVLAFRVSAPALSAAEKARVRAAHDALTGADADAYFVRHLEFHLALYAAAGARLRGLVETHIRLAERYLRYERAALAGAEEDAREHRALRDAAILGDAEAGAALLQVHIGEGGQDIAAAIAAGGSGGSGQGREP